MKTLAFPAVIAGGFVAPILGLASSAMAAPSGPGSAQDTVDTLRASGYHVVMNKVGAAPMDQCAVSGVRRGNPVTVSADPRVVYTTVYVDLQC